MDTGRILWGLILLALGGVLLAGQLDVLDTGAVISTWWPLAVIAAGLLRLVERPRDVTGAGAVVVLGLVLLGWRLDLFDLSVVFPIVLIGAGLWVLFRRSRGGRSAATVGANTIDVVAAFSGRQVRATAPRFDGGRVVAVLGGAEVDLRDATLPPDGATLEVVVVLGGVDLTVPAGWAVRVTGPAILGGIDEKTLPAPDGAPVLELKATVLLGGIDVKTDPRARTP